jgi:hypothetical protein
MTVCGRRRTNSRHAIDTGYEPATCSGA